MSEKVKSPDGTVIAYDKFGDGSPVVISGGTLGDRLQQADVAELLAKAGFAALNFDRIGRGETVLRGPYVPEREDEDLDAMIKVAGGSACVCGTSGPGFMALMAAANGLSSTIERLGSQTASIACGPAAINRFRPISSPSVGSPR